MRSHALRIAIAPGQEYVCHSCRLQVFRRLHPESRRYQHNDGFPQKVQEDSASKSSFADRMRAFLSSDVAKQSVKAASQQAQDTEDSGQLDDRQYNVNDVKGNVSLQKLQAGSVARRKKRHSVNLSKRAHRRSAKRQFLKKKDRKHVEGALGEQGHNASEELNKTTGLSPEDAANGIRDQGKDNETLTATPQAEDVERTTSSDTRGATEIATASAIELKESPPRPPRESKHMKASKAKDTSVIEKIEKATKRTEKVIKEIEGAPKKNRKSGVKQSSPASETERERKANLRKRLKANVMKLRESLDKAHSQDQQTINAIRKVQQNKAVAKYLTDFNMIRKVETRSHKEPVIKNEVPNVAAPRTAGITKGSPSVIETIKAADLKIGPVEVEQPPVPRLAHGLERVLFNPGVYQLQDPRSRVYNFDPYLQKIMPVADFDFRALKEYITSSKDESLQIIAKQQGKRYVGSTSSMTGVLAHFHYLLSQWRSINTSMLSKSFPDSPFSSFTEIQRIPQAIFLRWKDGSYAIDADKQFDTSNILSMLGKSMEKLLTLDIQDFERYRRSSSTVVPEKETKLPESYHYSTLGDFLMRSQLDAHDPRLPGTGMFDLKTRAVVSIRMDVANYEHGTGYEIKDRQGEWESYEREYFDLIRAAFLKYSMQVRMGRMDGIFVAFHNIERIFGFQYISLPEMDNTIHGQWDTSIGDQEFKLSLELLNKILDKATKKHPETSIRLHFETRDAATPFMYIFAEPVTEEQVAEIQNANLAKAQEFDRTVLGRDPSQDDGPKWADIQANVEKAMDRDQLGLDEHKESDEARDELYESKVFDEDVLHANALEEVEDDIEGATTEDGEDPDDDVEEAEEFENGEERDEGEEECGEGNENDNVVERNAEDAEGGDLVNEEHDQRGESMTSMEPKGNLAEEGNVEDANIGFLEEPAGKEIFSDNAEQLERILEHSETDLSTANSATPAAPFSEVSAPPGFANGNFDFVTKADQPFLDILSSEHPVEARSDAPIADVLAMTLTLRNKVNGHYVLRPTDMTAEDKWEIEYSLVEVPMQSRAKALYEACQMRRQKKLAAETGPEGQEEVLSGYMKMLREMSAKGKVWRQEIDEKEKESRKPISVLGREPGAVA